MPTQSSANRSRSSRPTAARVSAALPCQRQPTSSPQASSTARPRTELSMSAAPRPATTAERAIGIDRNRSVTPRAASVVTATMVASTPKSMVRANMPGIRNSR